MTLDNAREWLCTAEALTLTASTSIILLRVYFRKVRLGRWNCSDWMNVVSYAFGLVFWVLTAVSLGHGFGKDSQPTDGHTAYETALVGTFTRVAASELELTATQMFLLGQVSTLACVGTARLATAFLLFEVWERRGNSTTARLSEVLERRGKWWAASVPTLFTCVEIGLATGWCTYDDTAGRFVIPVEAPKWLTVTIVHALLGVGLVAAWIALSSRLQMQRGQRVRLCVVFSTQLLIPAISIWHFSAYVDSLQIDARDSDLAPTVMSTQSLAFAAVFTTALPVVIKMPQKSHDEHELEEERRQDEASSFTRQTSIEIGEQAASREAASSSPQDTRPAPKTPPPSPQLPPPACGPTPPSPSLPTSPKLSALSAWPSTSTLKGSMNDGLFTCNEMASLPEWPGWSAISKN